MERRMPVTGALSDSISGNARRGAGRVIQHEMIEADSGTTGDPFAQAWCLVPEMAEITGRG